MSWTLRIPSAITNTRAFTPAKYRQGDVAVSQTSAQELVLEICGFASEAAARAAFARAELALLVGSMRHSVALRWPHKVGEVVVSDDPEHSREVFKKNLKLDVGGPLYGLANGDEPVVFPTDKIVKFVSAYDAKATYSSKIEVFAEEIRSALSHQRMDAWLADSGLLLSFEAFATAQGAEGWLPPRVRFLLLVICFEALLPQEAAHPAVVSFVDDCLTRLKPVIAAGAGEARRALESLTGSLNQLRERSIGQRFKDLAAAALSATNVPQDERNTIVASLGNLYKVRCKLVHEHKDMVEGKHVSMMFRIAEAALNARLDHGLGVVPPRREDPSEDAIRHAAYHRWLARQSDEVGDWIAAETELRGS